MGNRERQDRDKAGTHITRGSTYSPNSDWVNVTLRDHEGKTRVVTVRRGSVFPSRPKYTRAS